MQTIFVAISAYQDPELVPTLRDLFARAASPERIAVAVCYQYGTEASGVGIPDVSLVGGRVKCCFVPATDAQGLGMARSMAQAFYDDEDFYLQLDGHHRFADRWDEHLIEQYNKAIADGYANPLLTTYLPSYEPAGVDLAQTQATGITTFPSGEQSTTSGEEIKESLTAYRLYLSHFRDGGWTIPFERMDITGTNQFQSGYVVSGHFIFTKGAFAEEYRFDPKNYFYGEELSLSVRAYTMGYDILNPPEVFIWHKRTWGNGLKKVWAEDAGGYHRREPRSLGRIRSLTNQSPSGQSIPPALGLGRARTLLEWQLLTGVSFTKRQLSGRAFDSPTEFFAWQDQLTDNSINP